MPVETRYMRSDSLNINGLNTYCLGTKQTSTSKSVSSTLASCSVANLLPTSDVSVALSIYPTTPSTHYDKVDDPVGTPDDDSTYVYTAADGVLRKDVYGHTTLSVGTNKIAGVAVVVRYIGYGVQAGVRIGATDYLSSVLATRTTWGTVTAISWKKNPATGNDWTEADVNNAYIVVAIQTPSGQTAGKITQVYLVVYYYADNTVYFLVKAFKRASDGAETALTDYITLYSALISVFKDDSGTLRSTSVNILETIMDRKDSIVVRLYVQIGTGSPTLAIIFTTERLAAQKLDASTWTVYFYLKGENALSSIKAWWYWDTASYPSRIEGFAYTLVPDVRFLRSDQHTINGLTACKLDTPNSIDTLSTSALSYGYIGLRMFKRSSDGTETEIGTPNVCKAIAALSTTLVEVYASWSVPETVFSATDALVVKVYTCNASGTPYTLLATYISPQIGENMTLSGTITAFYWAYDVLVETDYYTNFYWGGSNRNSRIEGFRWTPYVPPVAVRIAYTDGLVCIA